MVKSVVHQNGAEQELILAMNSLKKPATSIISTVETAVSHEIIFIEAINNC